MEYARRIIDDEIDELLSGVSAIALEGAKAVGKTATALERVATVHYLDDPGQQTLVRADPDRLLTEDSPVLVDEWQRVPETWDLIRRAVDRDRQPNRFILTGSANPSNPGTHSGAGRIVRVRMRPLSLAERGVETPTVSVRSLLKGDRSKIEGHTGISLSTYTNEIVSSGFPGIRTLSGRAQRAQLDSYLAGIVDKDFLEMGRAVRNPALLQRWMRAYAAASSTTATLETIRDAASAGESTKPARANVQAYRSVLESLWILDPVRAWLPSRNRIARLSHPDKHQLVDPALAASLLGVTAEALLSGETGDVPVPRDGTLLGHLFESLLTLSIRVYAQAAEATIGHLRTDGGRHEIDLVIVRPDQKVVAVEIKLAKTVTDDDAKHLLWLRDQLGADLLDAVIISTGSDAYRRSDGIAVVPASLLGP